MDQIVLNVIILQNVPYVRLAISLFAAFIFVVGVLLFKSHIREWMKEVGEEKKLTVKENIGVILQILGIVIYCLGANLSKMIVC